LSTTDPPSKSRTRSRRWASDRASYALAGRSTTHAATSTPPRPASPVASLSSARPGCHSDADSAAECGSRNGGIRRRAAPRRSSMSSVSRGRRRSVSETVWTSLTAEGRGVPRRQVSESDPDRTLYGSPRCGNARSAASSETRPGRGLVIWSRPAAPYGLNPTQSRRQDQRLGAHLSEHEPGRSSPPCGTLAPGHKRLTRPDPCSFGELKWTWWADMPTVAINGLGRIGRAALKILLDDDRLDLGDAECGQGSWPSLVERLRWPTPSSQVRARALAGDLVPARRRGGR
jgi:hypothetical protein